ncbi:hypothetical protein HYDPIDRAFT_180817 [Hydnomerulius pinastri MD-312]|nr:hypothetical protein HYDPIDRAFT_180817 [Hydnomerulius pinastri MD-312]
MITGARVSLHALSRSAARSSVSAFSSTANANAATSQPKPSLALDPTLKSLLQDVDMSLTSHKLKRTDAPSAPPPRELEAVANDEGDIEYYDIDHEDYPYDEPARRREDRKSPAARFGSDGIGSVVLPPEMQRTVTALIEDVDKTLLHSDAKRLFAQEDGSEQSWGTAYDVDYKNRKQSYRHSERDGTAFASVILPAHYSAIYAVLQHAKHRLGASWNVERVMDWGSGTGSGLWATLSTFQKGAISTGDGPLLANSSVVTYLGIDKRDGLVSIGKQLLQKTKLGSLSATWQRSFHDQDRIDRAEGHETLALSAFNLSALPNGLAKKKMVQEMWDSGAHTIIIIDHNSPTGFENILEARQMLLDLGRKELEDPETQGLPIRGSHVVAPCPHDRPCPLHNSRLVCGFSQRLQRPSFVRLTKHAREGHEDIGYSYVVVRRGPRPGVEAGSGPVGRVGAVGREAAERAVEARSAAPRELERADESGHPQSPWDRPSARSRSAFASTAAVPDPASSADRAHEALRREAYGWPRLVFPPLKRSGHIIIDACTQEGKIIRLTIPKSQGKQPFYDARKSSWGDLFPHPPKNRPIERFAPSSAPSLAKGKDGGADIGKRSKGRDKKKGKMDKMSYAALDEKMRDAQKAKWKAERREAERREVRRARGGEEEFEAGLGVGAGAEMEGYEEGDEVLGRRI